ncbi:thioredoxin-like protein [Mycena olivaceomarginata]|nr:thioredoxin-like protein [Mycena olivaceomarginata]
MSTFPRHEYTLHLGSIAPDFEAETTIGPIKFHEWLGDSGKRNIKVIGISANGLEDHKAWIKDINKFGGKVTPTDEQFPIIADPDCKISYIYDMPNYQDATNRDLKGLPFTICTVFVIDPKKVICLTLSYPAVAGRSFVDKIIRVIDAIQLGNKHRIATPVNWKQGEEVILHASLINSGLPPTPTPTSKTRVLLACFGPQWRVLPPLDLHLHNTLNRHLDELLHDLLDLDESSRHSAAGASKEDGMFSRGQACELRLAQAADFLPSRTRTPRSSRTTRSQMTTQMTPRRPRSATRPPSAPSPTPSGAWGCCGALRVLHQHTLPHSTFIFAMYLLHTALHVAKAGSDTPPVVPYSRSRCDGLGDGRKPRKPPCGACPILVWNRSSAKADSLFEELGQHKVHVAQTLEQVVTECDVIYQQFVQTLKHAPPVRNKIFVETSTVGSFHISNFV